MASFPVIPNCAMSVFAALTALRKSTLYVSDNALSLSVMSLTSAPFRPVVTIVALSLSSSCSLYSSQAVAALYTAATDAPMAAVRPMVPVLQISRTELLTPSFPPITSNTSRHPVVPCVASPMERDTPLSSSR